MAEAGPQQPVVKMAAVGVEGRVPSLSRPMITAEHVRQRQRKNQQGEQQA